MPSERKRTIIDLRKSNYVCFGLATLLPFPRSKWERLQKALYDSAFCRFGLMAEARPRGRVIQYVCKAAFLGETHEHSSGLRWGLALEYGYIIIQLCPTVKMLFAYSWIFGEFNKKKVIVLFWENFVRQCEKIEKYPSYVVEELGFNKSAVTSWKNGALPRVASRKKIADYFGITVEELMGTKKEPAGDGGLDEQMKNIVSLLSAATKEERDAVETLLESKKRSLNDV